MNIFMKQKVFNLFKAQNVEKMLKCFQSCNEFKPKMTSKWIRNSFINYFVDNHNHLRVDSSPVVPLNDKTLHFVNAGMNQFKPIFQKTLSPTDPMNGFKRVVNSQKCIRVGGKHCDISAVGIDGRHQTFFEMLGNWSFGDYYKKESCLMAWDLLTNVFKLSPNRLIVTYFGGDKHLALEPDFETKDIWLKIGLPEHRIIPLGAKDNFWEMGETGPCGLCTEIHYLLEPTMSLSSIDLLNNSLEIWNIVFIQFDKKSNGKLDTLDQHFVDTGMGLERIASVIQNVGSNYETDLFVPYFQSIQKMSQCQPYSNSATNPLDISYRILADHSRMLTIAISDGLKPRYRGTGFILRQLIRKSIGIAANDFRISNFRLLFGQLSAITSELLGEAFPEIPKNLKLVEKVIDEEIEKYDSIVNENKNLVKLMNRIDMKYSIDLNQEIDDKLMKISHEIEDKIRDQSMDFLFLESSQRYLYSVKDLLTDYTINLRHNLSNDLNERIERLLEKLETYENVWINPFSQEFQTIVSNKSFKYFVHKIQTIGDTNIAFKIGLSHLRHKPTALFHMSPTGHEFCVVTAVPNEYHKYLKANDWLSLIADKVNDFQLLSTKNNIKRSHKISSFKSNSIERMDEAFSCAQSVANHYFSHL